MSSASKLYAATPFLAAIGLVFSVAGIGTAWLWSSFFASHDFFLWLIFYLPALWILWIFCAFYVQPKRELRRLLSMWLVIDLSVLLVLMSLAMSTEGGINAQGADMVLFLLYLPIIVPLGLVAGWLLHIANLSSANVGMLFDSTLGEVFAVWLEFSLIGALQSWILAAVSERFFKKRMNRESS